MSFDVIQSNNFNIQDVINTLKSANNPFAHFNCQLLRRLSLIHRFKSKKELIDNLSNKQKLIALVSNSQADPQLKANVLKSLDVDEKYYFSIVSSILSTLNVSM